MAYRKHRSMGELISSASFFGVGLWFLLESGDAYVHDLGLRAFGLMVCALACLLAAFRYPLHNLVTRLMRLRFKR